jgi:hypothetical protein
MFAANILFGKSLIARQALLETRQELPGRGLTLHWGLHSLL